MRQVLLLGLGVLALAGCQKKEAAATGEAKTAAAAAPAAPMSMKRKAGLWSQTIATGGMTQTMKLCLDEATDQQMQVTGQAVGKDMCSENTVTPTAGGWSFKSVCSMGQGGGTVTSTGSATGDFNSHYVVKASTVTAGSSMAQANGTHDVSIEATWEGPCPAGMKPGDMQLPGGVTINAAKMMGGGPPMGK
jgi:hypothetical protein